MTIVKQSQELFPLLAHLSATNELWFLWYVLFFYLLVYPLSFLEKYLSPGWLCFTIIMPAILLLAVYCHPNTHVIAPRSLILDPWVCLYFSCFFTLGWFAEKERILFHYFTRYLYPCFLFLLLGIVGLCLLGTSFDYEPNKLKSLFTFRLLHELISVSAVCLFFSLLYRYGDKPNLLLRYLADCSYWCYLSSIPFILTLQASLYSLPWPIAAKLLVVVCAVQILCCATYELFVRHTPLNRFVGNGKLAKKPLYPYTTKSFIIQSCLARSQEKLGH